MIKNGPKALLAAICLCILLCIVFFAIRSCTNDIPHTAIKPLTLDLNKANAQELDNIPGIGPALARAIVTYREVYGDYMYTEELLDVKGMSEELYNEIKEYFCIGGSR